MKSSLSVQVLPVVQSQVAIRTTSVARRRRRRANRYDAGPGLMQRLLFWLVG
jgi:hypothetical protein